MAEQKFEKDIEHLEKTVEALETGGLSLDEALKHFEQGIKLSRRCEKALIQAEKKIEILIKGASGKIAAEPFDTGEEPDAQPPPANGEPEGEDESKDQEELPF